MSNLISKFLPYHRETFFAYKVHKLYLEDGTELPVR